MRLNVNNYCSILTKTGLNNEDVCKRTGLSEKTLLWILDNGFIEESTLERIADAIGATLTEIIFPDFMGCTENSIEWQKDTTRATLTLSQRRTITRVKKLAEKHPEECEIVAENKDGSIVAHVPVSWIRINPGRELTDEQRREAVARLRRK